MSLREDIERLRSVPGAWKERPDPLGELAAMRHGEEESVTDRETYIANYSAALARERLYLEVIDTLMCAIASNIKEAISTAYNEAAEKIAAAKRIGLIAK